MVKPTKTAEELRKTSNIRAKRYQQAQRDQGKKHLSLLVSQEISDIIAEQRQKTGATIAKIVEAAIMAAYADPKPMIIPQAVKTHEPVELLPEVKSKEPEYNLFDAELMNLDSNPGPIKTPRNS